MWSRSLAAPRKANKGQLVAQTLVSAAPRLISALLPEGRNVSNQRAWLPAYQVEKSLDPADKSVCATDRLTYVPRPQEVRDSSRRCCRAASSREPPSWRGHSCLPRPDSSG